MTFDFNKLVTIGFDKWKTAPFRFYGEKEPFFIGNKIEQKWRDIILHGNTALTLVNAKADSLEYLKLFGDTEQLPEQYIDTVTLSGGCEQNGTPSPTTPVDIVCNNGVLKVSPNLFNINNQNQLNGASGTLAGGITSLADRWGIYIKVNPNTTYTVSRAGSTGIFYNLCITAVEPAIGVPVIQYERMGNNVSWTFTSDSNAKYLFIYTGTQSFQNFSLQIEPNATPTTYMPYGQIYTQGTVETVTDSNGLTASAERLLAVGDYKDTQEVLTGAITRNCGIVVLTGNEDITDAYNRVYRLADVLPSDYGIGSNTPCLCTHYTGLAGTESVGTMSDKSIKCGSGSDSRYYRTIYIKDTSFSSTSDVANYLATQYTNGTPVIIVYPTTSATTESATPQVLTKSPVTQTAGSISNLPIAITESSHTVPTPTQPLQINCNNGVVKVSKNLFNKSTITAGRMIKDDGTFLQNPSLGTSDYINIKNATNITVSINSRSVNSGAVCFFDANKTYISGSAFSYQDVKTLSVPANAVYIITTLVLTQLDSTQVELGSTATPYMPYGQIYVDGTTETVEITGKNLYDGTYVDGYYIDSNGTVTQGVMGRNAYSSAIKVIEGNAYTLSGITGNVTATNRIHGYNGTSTNDWVQQIDAFSTTAGVSYSDTFTIPNGVSYIRISQTLPLNSDVQLELGSTATTYEPYTVLGTATAENLFKVGTYQDVQSVTDGGVTRNVGVTVFDGTEAVGTYSNSVYILPLVDALKESAAPLLSSHFVFNPNHTTTPSLTNGEMCIRAANGRLFVKLSDIPTSDDVKQYLADQYSQGTPVIVVYPLATATTESVTGQPLTIQAGTNIVEITQASIDNLPLEVSYKAGVKVTITEVQNAQLDNNVEVTING